MMRLDKYLTLCGFGTRAQARALLRAGRVRIGGEPARNPAQAVDEQTVCAWVDGERAQYRRALHVMLYKPAGILTAARDARRRTVADLLPPAYVARGCMPVGRLDMDTEGLLLLTTDGQLAHRLLAPRRHVEKVYFAQLDGPVDEADCAAFAAGLALGDFTALPARLEPLPGQCAARVAVCEGKFHQVKRMFQARGRQVLYLKRLSFGGLALDERLAPGAWRDLTDEEAAALYAAAEGKQNGGALLQPKPNVRA